MSIISLHWLAVMASFLFGAIITLLWFLGAFRRIVFRKGTLKQSTFVYKAIQGPYSKVGPHFQAIAKFLTEHDMEDCPTAGIYYDDPETTNSPRSAVGFLLQEELEQRWNRLANKEKKQWNIINLNETDTVVCSFPMKWTAVSCALSAMKVYPAFRKDRELFSTMKSGSVEVYNSCHGVIDTHFPQQNFDQFNVRACDWSTKTD